jgi:hypothetical protein
MISIKDFTARLGNQLFQLASAISYAKSSEDSVAFPNWEYSKYFKGDFTPKTDPQPYRRLWIEHGFHHTQIPKGANLLGGYYQSEKYFIENEELIRSMFSFSDSVIESVRSKNSELLNQDIPKVSIHLRRGDYLKWPNHHPVLPIDYFVSATEKFPENSVYLVFSDDLQWCKDNFPEGNYVFIEGQTDVEDLCLMTMCDHNCIANSTFSWWGAWLNKNPNKIVVAPKKWFGPAYDHFSAKDLYCPSWIVI